MHGSIRSAVCAAVLLAALPATAALAQQPVEYTVRITAPEHHWMEIDVQFRDVPDGTLELRMSRSSPGRYALHEFAKNVFEVHAVNGAGEALRITRPDVHQWDVHDHDGTVNVTYKIYGDRSDGTYLQVDNSHAHMNSPATFMWARAMEQRPITMRLQRPSGSEWVVATQLFPTDDELVFTAPNLQYLMDSPIEFGDTKIFSFRADDQTFRVALHHQGTDDEALEYLDGVRAIVGEAKHVFGEFPRFDGGTYTFIADYLPWSAGDGMEHRNSTIVASRASLEQGGRRLLGTVSHEFFHAWNVERIRPASLEPFDFERANMSSELWLAEGFTSYYGGLIMHRAGVTGLEALLRSLSGFANAVTNSPGRAIRSAVDMSRLAPFIDAAQSVDRTYFSNTFLSYYTYGAAIGFALDLTLRDRSDGAITLDTYMRAMWERHGKPAGSAPPEVPNPYTVDDAREVLAEVSGDREFADEFFARYITGKEVVDYAKLLERAGLVLRETNRDGAYLGISLQENQGILFVGAPPAPGSPAYVAGLDQGDAIVSIDGTRLNTVARISSVLGRHAPGDAVSVRTRRRDGSEEEVQLTLGKNPTLEIVSIESAGGEPTAAQKTFRDAWLGSQAQ